MKPQLTAHIFPTQNGRFRADLSDGRQCESSHIAELAEVLYAAGIRKRTLAHDYLTVSQDNPCMSNDLVLLCCDLIRLELADEIKVGQS